MHSDAVAMQGVCFDGFHWKRKRAHFLNVVFVVPWDGHLEFTLYEAAFNWDPMKNDELQIKVSGPIMK